jgi:hypothetical protein
MCTYVKKRKKPYVNIYEGKEKTLCEEKKENATCVNVKRTEREDTRERKEDDLYHPLTPPLSTR